MKKIGIIGAGTFGPQLAALFAGCGVPILLFGRRGKARAARKNLARVRPPALFTMGDLDRIEALDMAHDIERLAECDWVIECIGEHVEWKRNLYATIADHLARDAILTSGTSGLSLGVLAEGLDERLRERFFITHFLFPPRYMKLVEVVADGFVDAEAIETVSAFLRDRLGKGIVRAKDTPNFVANRIGVLYVMDAIHRVLERGWPVEAVDAVMGVATGRPATGIFRLVDLVGVDTVASVAGTAVSNLSRDPFVQRCKIPQYMQRMIVNGWIGIRGGQGFYRRAGRRNMVIDPSRLDYRPQLKFAPASVAAVANEKSVAERLRKVVFARDPGGEIAWEIVSNMLVYAASVAQEVADDVASIDRAMRWGYGWEMGPFETWDALGVAKVCDRLASEGREVPRLARQMLDAGRAAFYEGEVHARHAVRDDAVVMKRPAGSMTDRGDGIALLSLETPPDATEDATRLIADAIDRAEHVWRGLIIACTDDVFLGHGNLYDLLHKARLKRWGEIDAQLVRLQQLGKRMRYASVPVMIASTGMANGIGAELMLACRHRYAWVESTVWMDHLMLGLVPAAGGCLALLRTCQELERDERSSWRRGASMCDDGGPQPKVKRAFDLLADARKSMSAFDAKQIGMGSRADGVAMDRESLLGDAKDAMMRIADGYVKHRDEALYLPGRGGARAVRRAIDDGLRIGRLRSDDAAVYEHLVHILAGSDEPTAHLATDDHILEREREVFLRLAGTPTTQARIENYLKTGTYLR